SRRYARCVAGQFVIAAALEGRGAARETVAVIEQLTFVHADRRTRDRIDPGAVAKEMALRDVDGRSTRDLDRTAADVSPKKGISNKAEGIRLKVDPIGVSLNC